PLTDAEDPCNVLVIQTRSRASLLIEPSDDLGIRGLISWQKFERDVPIELRVERTINRAHSAHADDLLEEEPIEHITRAWQGWGRQIAGAGCHRSTSRRTARPPVRRRRPGRLGQAHARRYGRCLVIGFGRLGDRHRLVLNSSGFIPFRYFRAWPSRRI